MKTVTPNILDLGHGVRVIEWPGVAYLESTDPEKPLCVDKGGRHLGETTPGVAVPFMSRSHGELHKHFGICEDENGHPLAYGKGASITATPRAKDWLVSARIGGTIVYKGKQYTIRRTANDNIAFDLV